MDESALSEGHREALERARLRCEKLTETLEALDLQEQPIVLEIGCGHGHYLAAYAEAHPQARCLGVDLVSKRIEKACKKASKRGLEHLHFLKAEIDEFLEVLPAPVRLERIFMLFPDPWPKKRHTKNRMLQQSLLSALAERSEAGVEFCFRSDHPLAVAWAREQLALHPQWELAAEVGWPFEHGSFFQDLLPEYESLLARRC